MSSEKTVSINKAKQERLEARLPADVKAVIQHAADLTGRTLSDFVVSSAQRSRRRDYSPA